MSERGTYWASFIERIFGLVLIVLGAVLLYLTVSTADLGGFIGFFSFLSIVMVIIGVFLLIVKPSE
jgi:membrane-bound ClpP family serine protease